MASRLDRLLLLLDSGSSASVRSTAATQLAQLAAKSVVSDDITELIAVVARIVPYLHSKSHDTRAAASDALSQIFSLVSLWTPRNTFKSEEDGTSGENDAVPEFPAFDVKSLIYSGSLLLASSGNEFTKPAGILSSPAAVTKARKDAMRRLGLDFLDNITDGDEMDIEKELVAEAQADTPELEAIKSESTDMDVVKPEKPEPSPEPSAKDSTPPAPSPQPEDLSGLSARERNRLKRKRKPGQSAFVAPPPSSTNSKFTPTPSGPTSTKARLVASEEASHPPPSRVDSPSGTSSPENKVIIDPTKGGAVAAKSMQLSKALDVPPGTWIWDGLCQVLEVDLFSPIWQVRHGAAMAIRELLKFQGKHGGMCDGVSERENERAHEKWCNDLAAKFLCVFVLDRFGDFVSDQMVAPVRETVSQTLAALLIHMPPRSVLHVHSILLQMIHQDFQTPERPLVWQVRHAGLLGIKYQVAVRNDIFGSEESGHQNKGLLKGLVDAAILGLSDQDDDVRSVAASALLPVAKNLVAQLPDQLERVLLVLWRCLSDLKDDLSASVGVVMDLVGMLVGYDDVIKLIGDPNAALPLTTLAPSLYPFFRHTISNVRLAVVKTLSSFMTVPSLPKSWISLPFLRLLFQNLVSEDREDVRNITLETWKSALEVLASRRRDGPEGLSLEEMVDQQQVLDWYAIVTTPLGVPIDTTPFYYASLHSNHTNHNDGKDHDNAGERHNVDKAMLSQDLSLVSLETVLRARVAAAKALAHLMASWRSEPVNPESGRGAMEELFGPILLHYADSTSMLQKFLAATISEEWALLSRPQQGGKGMLALELSARFLAFLQGPLPPAYHEMALSLVRLHVDCQAMLQAFALECRLPVSSIPFLGTEVDITSSDSDPNSPNKVFTLSTAYSAIGSMYDRLKNSLGRTKKKEMAIIVEKRDKIVQALERYEDVKKGYDTRVCAAFAAAYVALGSTPEKVSPIVKGIMNGIKVEENVDLQTRSAVAVASFIDFCAQHGLVQPPDKIVKNLCTFLCQDVDQTPTFAFECKHLDGILSFRPTLTSREREKEVKDKEAKDKDGKAEGEKEKEVKEREAKLSRRGAQLAFAQLSARFEGSLFEVVPNMWQSMAGGLLNAFTSESREENDEVIEKKAGQDIIDSLSVLQAVTPTLNPKLHPRIVSTLPVLAKALRSKFAIIRQAAAKCFAVVCDVITSEGMHHVIEHIMPLIADPIDVRNRQGAVELIYHIVQTLDVKALPYVIFLVVPILGRMSDSDDDIRSVATNTFASLVKMVPLEAGLPDPPGFSAEMIQRRETERQFLMQLLDGSKVDQYSIPVTIKAELRKYQQDGVNWLAFLAKYQLHGILCDDMGLGKTLQSICILASKHHERATRYAENKSPDSVHLPSLIVCPPTLTGHWYYEIQKYTDNLKPILYTGNSRDRNRRLASVKNYDVVITSYDIVRNDISSLAGLDWLYCILDEGHVIKNAKTKLTKAVKGIKSQHRLILSGTPIQNNVLELWSLFDFLMPGFLGTEGSFNERFGKPILSNRDGKSKNGEAAALALEALHKQVLPFLLRRLKEDVLHDLPPKIIQDHYCELSELQKALYDDLSKSQAPTEDSLDTASTQTGENGAKGRQHIFQALQYLRKLCNHPALVLKDDQEQIEAALQKIGSTSKEGIRDINHAPKLLALKQLLNDCGIGIGGPSGELKSETADSISSSDTFSQHRVLIFCQMKQMLDIIETDLFKSHMPTVTYMRLDGNVDANKRHAIVQTFNSDPSIDCLLLTTHVGGLGLTLTGADTVIFVEHDWNPMKDLQAMDRAHRIGQKKVVNVYRLIAKGTLEEKIMGLQRFKLNIANSVVTQQNSGLSSMDTELVLDLFRRTSEDEDAASSKKKKVKDTGSANGTLSQKNILQGLEDLPPEDEYGSLDLSSFMGSLSRDT